MSRATWIAVPDAGEPEVRPIRVEGRAEPVEVVAVAADDGQ